MPLRPAAFAEPPDLAGQQPLPVRAAADDADADEGTQLELGISLA